MMEQSSKVTVNKRINPNDNSSSSIEKMLLNQQQIDENSDSLMQETLKDALDRQELILKAMNNDSSLPLVYQTESYQELCTQLNMQLGYVFEYYYNLTAKKSSQYAQNMQKQLFKEKEKLQSQLNLSTEYNKKLLEQVKKLGDDLELMKKGVNDGEIFESSQISGNIQQYTGSQLQPTQSPSPVNMFAHSVQNKNRKFSNQMMQQLKGSLLLTNGSTNGQAQQTNEQIQVLDVDENYETYQTLRIENDNLQQQLQQFSGCIQEQEEKLKYQQQVIFQMEKEMSSIKEQHKQYKDTNFQQYQLYSTSSSTGDEIKIMKRYQQQLQQQNNIVSLSGIEEVEMEEESQLFKNNNNNNNNTNSMLQKGADNEEKDIIINTLQQRINLLLQKQNLSLNVFSNDMAINMHYDYSPSPQGHKRSAWKSYNGKQRKQSLKRKSPFSAIYSKKNYLNNDFISAKVNQAQIIEELLKKKNIGAQQPAFDFRKSDLYLKTEQLNREYIELIKKFQELQKDKLNQQKIIDELVKINGVLEKDFEILFKQVQDHKQQRLQQEKQNKRKEREQQIIINQEVEDINSLLEYIEMLFEEKQYYQGGKVWQKIEYEDLKKQTASRSQKNIDYLKIVLKLKDEIIARLEDELSQYKSMSDQGIQIGEEKIALIADRHFRMKDERLLNLENGIQEEKQRGKDLQDQLKKLENQNNLLQGEKELEKKKGEKLKKDNEDLQKEIAIMKESFALEVEEKYEKEIEELMKELRLQKKENERLQKEIDQLKQQQRKARRSGLVGDKKFTLDQLGSQTISRAGTSLEVDLEEQKVDLAVDQQKNKGGGGSSTHKVGGAPLSQLYKSMQNSKTTLESSLENRKFLGLLREENRKESIKEGEEDQYSTEENQKLKTTSKRKEQEGKQINEEDEEIIDDEYEEEDDQLDGFTKENEKYLRGLYSQFFNNEHKLAQDKIRNKNQIFKNVYDLLNQQNESLKQRIKSLNKENRVLKEREIQYSELIQEFERESQESQKLILNMIIKHSESLNLSNEYKKDLNQLKVSQLVLILMEQIKTILQNYKNNEFKKPALKKLRIYTSETEESEIDNLTRDEALLHLKELSIENEDLLQRAESLTQQLNIILEKVEQLKRVNEELEEENQNLKQKVAYAKVQKERSQKSSYQKNSLTISNDCPQYKFQFKQDKVLQSSDKSKFGKELNQGIVHITQQSQQKQKREAGSGGSIGTSNNPASSQFSQGTPLRDRMSSQFSTNKDQNIELTKSVAQFQHQMHSDRQKVPGNELNSTYYQREKAPSSRNVESALFQKDSKMNEFYSTGHFQQSLMQSAYGLKSRPQGQQQQVSNNSIGQHSSQFSFSQDNKTNQIASPSVHNATFFKNNLGRNENNNGNYNNNSNTNKQTYTNATTNKINVNNNNTNLNKNINNLKSKQQTDYGGISSNQSNLYNDPYYVKPPISVKHSNERNYISMRQHPHTSVYNSPKSFSNE